MYNNFDIISETYEDIAKWETANSSISITPLQSSVRYGADSILCLCLLICTQLVLKFAMCVCEIRTPWVKKCVHENSFWQKVATQGHSRTRACILQSITGRWGIACCHIIRVGLSRRFPKTIKPKTMKIAVVHNPTVMCRLFPRNSQILAFIFQDLLKLVQHSRC